MNNDIEGVCISNGGEVCNTGSDYFALSDVTATDNLYQIDPEFFTDGELVESYALTSDSPLIQQGIASAPQIPTYDYTGTVPMASPPDLGALQYCQPDLSVSISSSETVDLGRNVTWNITLTNNADCVSNDNTLALTFTNSEYQSGEEASASLVRELDVSSDNVTCTGSGTTATCTISQIANASSVELSVVSNTLDVGEIGLSATLNNAFETASGSDSGATTVVYPTGGCALHQSDAVNLSGLWVYGCLLVLPVWRLRKT